MAKNRIDYFGDIKAVASMGGIDSKQRQSLQWFKDNIESIYGRGQVNNMDLINEQYGRVPNNARPGRMLMFRYDPKLKSILPYYDKFPLVITLDVRREYMLGLNLHYLPPKQRNLLFSHLLGLVNDITLSDNARIIATYKMLKGSSKLRWFKPCIKKYLPEHVKSKAAIIPPEYWTMAVNLPTEQFIKENRHKVWSDSINKVR